MMRTTSRKRNSSEIGSTVVELTLVLLMIVWILIGTIDVAQVIYFQHSLAYRVKRAVRWASAVPYNETQVRNMVIYDNPAGGTQPALLGLNSTNSSGASIVSVQLLGAGTTSARVEVRVDNYPFRFFTPGIARAYTAKPIIASYTHEPSLP
jgi:hypothetical protein